MRKIARKLGTGHIQTNRISSKTRVGVSTHLFDLTFSRTSGLCLRGLLDRCRGLGGELFRGYWALRTDNPKVNKSLRVIERGQELVKVMAKLSTNLNRKMSEIILSTMHGVNHISIGSRELGQISIKHLTLSKGSSVTSRKASKNDVNISTLLIGLDILIKGLFTNLSKFHVAGTIKRRGIENLIGIPRVNINPGVILNGLSGSAEHHQKSISFTIRIYSSEVTTSAWTATAVRLASGRVLQGKEVRLRPSCIIST
nr:MAG TPA: hypothetical protein [Microviridae sp.]